MTNSACYPHLHYRAAGDSGVLVEFGQGIDASLNRKVRLFDLLLGQAGLPGVRESVPAYCSLLVLYDPLETNYAALSESLRRLEGKLGDAVLPTPSRVDVPVLYGGECGPDLEAVANLNHLSVEEVVRCHTSSDYLVFMMGFMPGFAYLGGLSTRIAAPRLVRPRLSVPAGSVGIAGEQTGIYPIESPGGWRLIGRTPLRLFAPEKRDPTLLHVGDCVRFRAIGQGEFESLTERTCPSPARVSHSMVAQPSRLRVSACSAVTPIASETLAPHGFGEACEKCGLERDDAASAAASGCDETREVPGRGGEPILTVVQPGVLTTLQDRGRQGLLRLGIPPSGAMDEYALAAANLLCGNGRDAAALEITLYGGAFEFMRRTVAAVCGADLSPSLNGRPLSMWRAVPVNRGDLLRFGSARAGCRAYLAIAGGFAAPRSLGSRATFVRARLGGLEGRALQKGDVLFAYSAVRPKTGGGLPAALIPRYPAHLEVRVVLGPQQDAFTQAGTNAFLGGEYLVTPASDRMGYRLSGPRIGHVRGADIVTDPVPPGAVQVPGDGQPILLAADRQTTGGYAKIAVVLAADLDAVGQLRPGDRIRFRAVDLGEANRALHARQNRFQALQTAVR